MSAKRAKVSEQGDLRRRSRRTSRVTLRAYKKPERESNKRGDRAVGRNQRRLSSVEVPPAETERRALLSVVLVGLRAALGRLASLRQLSLLRAYRGFSAQIKPERPIDPVLASVVIGLTCLGIVMVFSASGFFAEREFGNGTHFLIRQAIFAGVGISAMLAISSVPYTWFRALTYPALAVSVVLLLAVLFGLGGSIRGTSRWLALGPIHIQPAELAKLSVILWLAHSLAKKRDKVRSFSIGFLPHALIAAFIMILCERQPDLGSALMVGALTFVLLFTAGAKTGYLIGAAMVALPIVYALIATSDYRMRRIKAFLAPFEHKQAEGYQLSESIMSFGAGGTSGAGFGAGRQKLLFLPDAHTDFISAIIGEELGFVGIVCVITGFLCILWRGMRIALDTSDRYALLLAVGCTLFVCVQGFTNLSVAMGLVPTKGLALPFLSYGGSSLMVNLMTIGLLLSVGRFAPQQALSEEKAVRKKKKKRSSSKSRNLRKAA